MMASAQMARLCGMSIPPLGLLLGVYELAQPHHPSNTLAAWASIVLSPLVGIGMFWTARGFAKAARDLEIDRPKHGEAKQWRSVFAWFVIVAGVTVMICGRVWLESGEPSVGSREKQLRCLGWFEAIVVFW